MPVVMIMHWPEVTPAIYEETRRRVKWESDQPAGARNHVSWFESDGLHVVDVWENAEGFQTFVDQRLTPVTKAMNVPGEPRIQIHPAHAHFVPERVKKEAAPVPA